MISRPQPLSILERLVKQLGRVLVAGQAPDHRKLDEALRVAIGLPGNALVKVDNERWRVLQAVTEDGVVAPDWEARLRAQRP